VGQYLGKSVANGVTTIRLTPAGQSTQRSFECASNLAVTYQGSPATLSSLSVNDTITVTVVDGKAAAVVAEQKTTTLSNAVVQSMNIDGDEFTMTVKTTDGDEIAYAVDDKVSIMKDGVSVEIAKLYRGDKVNLTLEYGVITKIVATSTVSTVEGTIKEIKIATQPSITVTVDGVDKQFDVPNDATMTRNDSEASLYDFRVGDIVKLTLESSAVTKISTTSVVTSDGSIIGVVDAVNTSFGFITITPKDSNATQTVFYHVNKVTVLDKQGVTKSVSNIKVGNTVYATGNILNGAFTANVIVITEE
jgi:hypothetical protein